MVVTFIDLKIGLIYINSTLDYRNKINWSANPMDEAKTTISYYLDKIQGNETNGLELHSLFFYLNKKSFFECLI